MTRAMDTLVLSRATYRRRYGTDMPEASIPSRFLEEVPAGLVEEMGARGGRATRQQRPQEYEAGGTHYSYEDEDQSVSWKQPQAQRRQKSRAGGAKYNSIDNIAEFFASRGKRFNLPKVPVEAPTGRRGFRPGQKVRHPKYGEGTVYQREGEGEEAKLTVQFPRFGLKN